MTLAEIAQAGWTYTPRTLADGTPPAPSTELEVIAKAIWEHGTRTLSVLPAFVGVLQLVGGSAVLVAYAGKRFPIEIEDVFEGIARHVVFEAIEA